MSDSAATRWRRCSTCKREIGFDQPYWVCSVSTCNRVRAALQFCSVSCWDAHVPILRHRGDAGAVEERSPKTAAEAAAQGNSAHVPGSGTPPRSPGAAPSAAPPAAAARSTAPARPLPTAAPAARPAAAAEVEREILIVASKLKNYIRQRSGFNTSDGCMEALSDHVRAICERAIANARADERRTVLARDIPKPG